MKKIAKTSILFDKFLDSSHHANAQVPIFEFKLGIAADPLEPAKMEYELPLATILSYVRCRVYCSVTV